MIIDAEILNKITCILNSTTHLKDHNHGDFFIGTQGQFNTYKSINLIQQINRTKNKNQIIIPI
jgi:hypothetical protein